MNAPSVTGPIPITDSSVPFGTAYRPRYGIGIDLAGSGYVEEEYLISGTGDIYEHNDAWKLQVKESDVPYTTRVVVRRPADASACSGVLHMETFHPLMEASPNWTSVCQYIMREGHMWAGVTLQPQNAQRLGRTFDAERYKKLNLRDVGQGWDIMSQLGAMLKSNAAPSPLEGVPVRYIYVSGLSYTGSWIRVFVQEGFHARTRTPNGGPVYDGYLIRVSSGGFGRGGYLPINSEARRIPIDDPRRVIQPRDVPLIEMLSEGESETNLKSRRPDSDEPRDRFRLYEVAGASHTSGPASERAEGAPRVAEGAGSSEEGAPPQPVEAPNEFPSGYLAMAVFDNLHRWVTEGTPPPRADRLQIMEDHSAGPVGASREALPLARDEHGNALGGVRSPYVDVPFATYSPHSTPSPQFDLRGSQVPFSKEKLAGLYKNHEDYVDRVRRQVDEMVRDRWLLPPEAERIKAQAASADIP